ncbi:MAG: hypothetical protein ACI85V_001199 [bacterium]
MLGIVLLYLLATIGGALVPGPVAQVSGSKDTTIVLVAGTIHYDLLLPTDTATLQAFGFLEEVGMTIGDADWIVVGWGSRAFYTSTGTYADLDASVIWDAATGDSSVFRFDLAYGDWTEVGSSVVISHEQLALLRGQILQDLDRDDAGGAVLIPGAALSATDVFYEANSHFSIFRTCNVWIAEVLRGAGVPMGIWTPTPYSVSLSRWWFG